MYTTAPLPPLDTLNSHTGLAIFVVLWIIGSGICAVIITAITDDRISEGTAWLLSYIIPLAYVAHVSFTTGEVKQYANTKVEGQLVNFIAEGYNQEVRSGKSTYRQDVHLLYAVYKIEGVLVPITISPGQSMPERAIFYKN